jgi:hypothetical protein
MLKKSGTDGKRVGKKVGIRVAVEEHAISD